MEKELARTTSAFSIYKGTGQKQQKALPSYDPPLSLDDPAGYLADTGLCNAVNAALLLGQPLLISGEPGTGKTQLAHSLAYEFSLLRPLFPLVFNVKTTSTARELFYRYDALEHFQAAQISRLTGDPPANIQKYITFQALGLAIILASERTQAEAFVPKELVDRIPMRSIVLLDEIDKAPRDLPNDVLNEIDHMEFTVKETGQTFQADPQYRPVLIMTSNSERNFPDAFLRRCVFYHIDFPDRPRLQEIIRNRLQLPDIPQLEQLTRKRIGEDAHFTEEMLNHALNHFDAIRKLPLKRKPGTAELLNWLRILQTEHLDVMHPRPDQQDILDSSYAVLLKNKEDRTLLKQLPRKEG